MTPSRPLGIHLSTQDSHLPLRSGPQLQGRYSTAWLAHMLAYSPDAAVESVNSPTRMWWHQARLVSEPSSSAMGFQPPSLLFSSSGLGGSICWAGFDWAPFHCLGGGPKSIMLGGAGGRALPNSSLSSEVSRGFWQAKVWEHQGQVLEQRGILG